jgi:hypothetical protein
VIDAKELINFLLGNDRHISNVVLIVHNFSDLVYSKVNHCILNDIN